MLQYACCIVRIPVQELPEVPKIVLLLFDQEMGLQYEILHICSECLVPYLRNFTNQMTNFLVLEP